MIPIERVTPLLVQKRPNLAALWDFLWASVLGCADGEREKNLQFLPPKETKKELCVFGTLRLSSLVAQVLLLLE